MALGRLQACSLRAAWVLLLAAWAAGPAAAQPTGEETRRLIGDWQVACVGGDCRAVQSLVDSAQPGIAYGSEFKYVGGGREFVVNLSLPLGIYLPRGVGLRVGDERRDVPVTVCLPGGCQALLVVDPELREAFRQEDSYVVRFYTTSDSPGEVTFSLRGFGEAEAAMSGDGDEAAAATD